MALVFQRQLQGAGHLEEVQPILEAMKVSMSFAFEKYREKFGIDEAFMQAYRAAKQQAELDSCAPFPGAARLCRDIAAAGRYNYLCTHRSSTALAILRKWELYDCFRDFTTSENNFARKPSPEAIYYLMEKYGLQAGEILMVGDRELDILAGKNAGADACFFAGQGGASAHADYSVTAFSELYDILGISRHLGE